MCAMYKSSYDELINEDYETKKKMKLAKQIRYQRYMLNKLIKKFNKNRYNY